MLNHVNTDVSMKRASTFFGWAGRRTKARCKLTEAKSKIMSVIISHFSCSPTLISDYVHISATFFRRLLLTAMEKVPIIYNDGYNVFSNKRLHLLRRFAFLGSRNYTHLIVVNIKRFHNIFCNIYSCRLRACMIHRLP